MNCYVKKFIMILLNNLYIKQFIKIVSIFILGLLIMKISLYINEEYYFFCLVIILLVLVFVPWIISLRKKNIDYFEPIHIIGIQYFLYFGARSVYLYFDPAELMTSSNLIYSVNALLQPLILSVIGYILFLIGYYSKIPQAIVSTLPRLRSHWNEKRTLRGFYFFAVIGIISFSVLAIFFGRFYAHSLYSDVSNLAPGTFFGLLGMLKQFMLIAVVLGAIYYYSRKGRKDILNSFVFIFLIVIVFLNYFLIGAKQGAIFIFLYFLIPMHYLKKKISMKLFLTIGIILFLSFPIFYIYRLQSKFLGRENFSVSAIAEDLSLFQQAIGTFDVGQFFKYTLASIINRFHGMDSLALIIQDPNIEGDITNKYSSLLAFVMWIPRVIWPGKPTMADIQIWFGKKYWGINWLEGMQIPTTQLGELIIIFGSFGVLGMLVYGIITKAVYLYFIKPNPDKTAVLLYPFFFIKLVSIETSFGFGLVNLMYMTIIMLLIARWISGRKLFMSRQIKSVIASP